MRTRKRIVGITTSVLLTAAALACEQQRDLASHAESGAPAGGAAGSAPPPMDKAASVPVVAPGAVARNRASLGFGGAAREERAPEAPGAGDAAQRASAAVADPAARVAPDMVIRTGQASVQVDSLDEAIAHVRQLATRVGGVIANSSLRSGRDQVRSATLEVRVPAARFDDLVAGLEPFGKVETVDVTAEDVGEEYVDVSARVDNARRLESRLVDILATRTGKLAEVLAVERELARVREEIERYEGRLRYLKSRSAVSTLAVTVHESFPILAGQPATNPIAHAFVRAWRNFVALLAATIAAMGVLVPVAAVAGLAWVGVRRVRQPGATVGRREA